MIVFQKEIINTMLQTARIQIIRSTGLRAVQLASFCPKQNQQQNQSSIEMLVAKNATT